MQPTMTPLTLNTILPGNRLVKSLRLYIDCLRRRGLPDYDRCVLGSITRNEVLLRVAVLPFSFRHVIFQQQISSSRVWIDIRWWFSKLLVENLVRVRARSAIL